MDVLEETAASLPGSPRPPLKDRMRGWYKANKRRIRRRTKTIGSDATRSLEHQRKKNPGIPLEEMKHRIARFQKVLGQSRPIGITRIHPTLFRIDP
jgi:hypothetical protein